jgi:hypothetical protein
VRRQRKAPGDAGALVAGDTRKRQPQQKSPLKWTVSFYFFLPDPNVGCQPAIAPFWLGAAVIVLTFSFFAIFDSRLLLAMLSPWADRHHDVTLHNAMQSHSGRQRGTLAILNRRHGNMIAINAFKGVLVEIQTYRCDIAKHHQCLAVRAYPTPDSGGSDQRLKL